MSSSKSSGSSRFDRLGVVEVALDQQLGAPARRQGRDVVLRPASDDERVLEAAKTKPTARSNDTPPRYMPGRFTITAAQSSGVIELIGVTT